MFFFFFYQALTHAVLEFCVDYDILLPVALWFAHLYPDQVDWGPSWGHCVVFFVLFLGKNTLLSQCLSPPRCIYKYVLVNLMLGVTLLWTTCSIPSSGSRNTRTLSHFKLKKPEIILREGAIFHIVTCFALSREPGSNIRSPRWCSYFQAPS